MIIPSLHKACTCGFSGFPSFRPLKLAGEASITSWFRFVASPRPEYLPDFLSINQPPKRDRAGKTDAEKTGNVCFWSREFIWINERGLEVWVVPLPIRRKRAEDNKWWSCVTQIRIGSPVLFLRNEAHAGRLMEEKYYQVSRVKRADADNEIWNLPRGGKWIRLCHRTIHFFSLKLRKCS